MKTFVQYGAGNIGRGFIGQLFSQGGFKVKFIDVNMEVIDGINSRGTYPVTIVESDSSTDIWIKNVSGIDGRDSETVAKAISEADCMATAVGVNILPRIVDNIAAGINIRAKAKDPRPLDIIICENKLGADKFLHDLISQKLEKELLDYFESHIGFVEASIGRMVPVMTEEQRKEDPLRVCVEKYAQLPVDKDAFKGEVPGIPGIYPYSPFGLYIERKLFIHNMGHAFTAYLGNITGVEYIWESVEDPYVKILVQRAMQESALALSEKFGHPLASLLDHIGDLLIRFSNKALGDTIQRVGNDINRKLSPNDRLIGALNCCLENDILPVYIPAAIASALFFDLESDTASEKLREDIRVKGPEYVLENHCGLAKGSRYMNMILDYHEQLRSSKDFSGLLDMAEKNQAEINVNRVII